MKALTKTDFNFPGQKSVYHGKVRDVYNINGEQLVMVVHITHFSVVHTFLSRKVEICFC